MWYILPLSLTSLILISFGSFACGKNNGDGVFLTNMQLKRLIEENVLRKADIAKVPVCNYDMKQLRTGAFFISRISIRVYRVSIKGNVQIFQPI